MRLGQQGDDRDPLAPQEPLELRQMTKARHRRAPVPRVLRSPHDRRQIAEEDLVDADRKLRFQLSREVVQLRKAALDKEDVQRFVGDGGPNRSRSTSRHSLRLI